MALDEIAGEIRALPPDATAAQDGGKAVAG